MTKLNNLTEKQIIFLRNKLLTISSRLMLSSKGRTPKEEQALDMAICLFDEYIDTLDKNFMVNYNTGEGKTDDVVIVAKNRQEARDKANEMDLMEDFDINSITQI